MRLHLRAASIMVVCTVSLETVNTTAHNGSPPSLVVSLCFYLLMGLFLFPGVSRQAFVYLLMAYDCLEWMSMITSPPRLYTNVLRGFSPITQCR